MRVFNCNLPPTFFWQNDGDLFRATAVTRGWNGYRNKSQLREENYPAAPAGTRTRDFSITNPSLPLSYPGSP